MSLFGSLNKTPNNPFGSSNTNIASNNPFGSTSNSLFNNITQNNNTENNSINKESNNNNNRAFPFNITTNSNNTNENLSINNNTNNTNSNNTYNNTNDTHTNAENCDEKPKFQFTNETLLVNLFKSLNDTLKANNNTSIDINEMNSKNFIYLDSKKSLIIILPINNESTSLYSFCTLTSQMNTSVKINHNITQIVESSFDDEYLLLRNQKDLFFLDLSSLLKSKKIEIFKFPLSYIMNTPKDELKVHLHPFNKSSFGVLNATTNMFNLFSLDIENDYSYLNDQKDKTVSISSLSTMTNLTKLNENFSNTLSSNPSNITKFTYASINFDKEKILDFTFQRTDTTKYLKLSVFELFSVFFLQKKGVLIKTPLFPKNFFIPSSSLEVEINGLNENDKFNYSKLLKQLSKGIIPNMKEYYFKTEYKFYVSSKDSDLSSYNNSVLSNILKAEVICKDIKYSNSSFCNFALINSKPMTLLIVPESKNFLLSTVLVNEINPYNRKEASKIILNLIPKTIDNTFYVEEILKLEGDLTMSSDSLNTNSLADFKNINLDLNRIPQNNNQKNSMIINNRYNEGNSNNNFNAFNTFKQYTNNNSKNKNTANREILELKYKNNSGFYGNKFELNYLTELEDNNEEDNITSIAVIKISYLVSLHFFLNSSITRTIFIEEITDSNYNVNKTAHSSLINNDYVGISTMSGLKQQLNNFHNFPNLDNLKILNNTTHFYIDDFFSYHDINTSPSKFFTIISEEGKHFFDSYQNVIQNIYYKVKLFVDLIYSNNDFYTKSFNNIVEILHSLQKRYTTIKELQGIIKANQKKLSSKIETIEDKLNKAFYHQEIIFDNSNNKKTFMSIKDKLSSLKEKMNALMIFKKENENEIKSIALCVNDCLKNRNLCSNLVNPSNLERILSISNEAYTIINKNENEINVMKKQLLN